MREALLSRPVHLSQRDQLFAIPIHSLIVIQHSLHEVVEVHQRHRNAPPLGLERASLEKPPLLTYRPRSSLCRPPRRVRMSCDPIAACYSSDQLNSLGVLVEVEADTAPERPDSEGVAGRGNSLPQCLHLIASRRINSAQKGHFLKSVATVGTGDDAEGALSCFSIQPLRR